MSRYIEESECACDTPTSSESRKCTYCRSQSKYMPVKRRKKKPKLPKRYKEKYKG